MLSMPGSEGIDVGHTINLTEVNGKPVISVFGSTPLEAWANALIKLGLIDEVMYETALESIAVARVDSMNEVKEKMETLKRQRQEARARQLQKMKDQSDVSQSPMGAQNGDDNEGGGTKESSAQMRTQKRKVQQGKNKN